MNAGELLVAQTVKNFPQCGRPVFSPWVGKISWRREWLFTPVFLPGEFHGQRSLVGYGAWDHKESDNWMTNTFIGDECWRAHGRGRALFKPTGENCFGGSQRVCLTRKVKRASSFCDLWCPHTCSPHPPTKRKWNGDVERGRLDLSIRILERATVAIYIFD